MNKRYQPIWQKALPYLNTRSNDKHTWYCYYFMEQLLPLHPEADADVVIPAILLHDVGWSAVPEDKQLLSFGPHMKYPELRRRHEVEGAKIARGILIELGYKTAVIDEICTIIDGHDTRQASLSLHDSLVKDADKLWRYTPFGLKLIGEWFHYSEGEQLALLEKWLTTRFYTETAVAMARGLMGLLFIQQHPTDFQKNA